MTCNSAVDDKFPQWIRVRTDDMDTPAGRYMLASGTVSDWADYGRWFALRQVLATTPGALLDVSDARVLGAVSRQLSFPTARRCREWLDALAACDAIDRELYEARSVVFDSDVAEAQQSYQARVRMNRRKGAMGGRPRAEGKADGGRDENPEGNPSGFDNESEGEAD